MNNELTNQALPVVVSAMVSDFSTLTDTLDDHDPLGLAFYFFAVRYSDYKNERLDDLYDVAKFWVQDKLSGDGQLSSYVDRDIGALALFVFTLKRYCSCPEQFSEFAVLISKHVDEDTGLFGSFFLSALGALGLRVTDPSSEATFKLERVLKREMDTRSKEIFNDVKNLAVAYLLAKEKNGTRSVGELIQESFRKVKDADLPRSDRIFPNFILLSEVRDIHGEERALSKRSCEESLDFIRTYSVEAAYPSELIQQYSRDAIASPAAMEGNGHRSRPRLSRIVLSFSLILIRLYEGAGPVFRSKEVKVQNFIRGLLYCVFWLAISVALFWAGAKLDLPRDLKKYYPLEPFTLLGCLALNLAWISALLLPLFPAIIFLDRLTIKGLEIGEVALLKDSLKTIREHWVWEIALVFLITFLCTLFS